MATNSTGTLVQRTTNDKKGSHQPKLTDTTTEEPESKKDKTNIFQNKNCAAYLSTIIVILICLILYIILANDHNTLPNTQLRDAGQITESFHVKQEQKQSYDDENNANIITNSPDPGGLNPPVRFKPRSKPGGQGKIAATVTMDQSGLFFEYIAELYHKDKRIDSHYEWAMSKKDDTSLYTRNIFPHIPIQSPIIKMSNARRRYDDSGNDNGNITFSNNIVNLKNNYQTVLFGVNNNGLGYNYNYNGFDDDDTYNDVHQRYMKNWLFLTKKKKKFKPDESIQDSFKRHYEINKHCSYNGKVFIIGMYKTGTTSLTHALSMLGYPCSRIGDKSRNIHNRHSCDWQSLNWANYFDYNSYNHSKSYSYSYNNNNKKNEDNASWIGNKINNIDSHLQSFIAEMSVFDISWMFSNKYIYYLIMYLTIYGYNFGDSPWLHIYPILNEWYPFPYSKFILTIRNNTYDVVNSDFKMNFALFKSHIYNYFKYDEFGGLNNHFPKKDVYDKLINIQNILNGVVVVESPINTNANNKNKTTHHHHNNINVKNIKNDPFDLLDQAIKDKVLNEFIALANSTKCDWIWKGHNENITLLECIYFQALRYELHNENVLKYFESLGDETIGHRLNNRLLVLNIDEIEKNAGKNENKEQWSKLTSFLGCDFDKMDENDELNIVSKKSFPHKNSAKESRNQLKYLIPPNFKMNQWKNFQFSNHIVEIKQIISKLKFNQYEYQQDLSQLKQYFKQLDSLFANA